MHDRDSDSQGAAASARAARGRRPGSPSPAPRRAPPAAAVIWGVCLAYALVRESAVAMRSTWLWGLDLQRFLPAWTVLPWALCFAVALVPASARALQRVWTGLARRTRRTARPIGIATAALVAAACPDQVMFVGDALLRHGILELPARFMSIFPQALPLDALVNSALPRALAAPFGLDPNLAMRVLCAAGAALFAAWSDDFARAIGARGTTRALVAATLAGGSWLTLFTGYSKPTVEICLLTLGVARFGVAMLTGNRGHLGLSACVALALGFHRSGIALLPAGLAAWWLWHRTWAPRRWGVREWSGAIVLGLGIAAFVPRIARLLVAFDLASPTAGAGGGMLGAAFAPLHLVDLAELVVFLTPAALLLPALRPAPARALPPVLLGIVIAGFAPLSLKFSPTPAALFTHPTLGLFRDWDVFAGAGVALACLVGWRIAHLGVALRRVGLAVAVLAMTLVPTTQLLVHDLLPARGLARARAFALEPPRRPLYEASLWDYVGLRAMRLQRWDEARDGFQHLARLAPHGRALLLWGTSAILARDFAEALGAFSELSRREPGNPLGPFGEWVAAGNLGATARRDDALHRVDAFPDSVAARIPMHLKYYPELGPYVAAAGRR